MRFPRSARIRLSSEFSLVRRKGRMVQGPRLRVAVWFQPGESSPARAGFVTSRRVGPAVSRNRVRRRLREIFRENRLAITPGCLVVTTAKTGAAEASFAELREEWLLLVRRLSILRVSE